MTLSRIHGRRRGFAAALVGGALVLSLSACNGDTPAAGGASGSDSPSATTSSTSSDAPSQPDSGTATGAVDNDQFLQVLQTSIDRAATGQVHMVMQAAGQEMRANGAADFAGDPTSMELSMNIPGVTNGAAKILLVDNVMYMNLGQMSQGKYVAFDLNDPASLPPGMGDIADQMDPLATFRSFQDALVKATFKGQEQVAGDQLDHYVVVADPSKMSMAKVPGMQLPQQITYDIWFDQSGLLRRTASSFAAGGQMVKVQFDVDHWGDPVTVKAPPASQVIKNPTSQTG